MSEKISTWQVLRNKFPANEYVLMEEVSDKSGFSRSRSLDYMLVNLWESRGLAITGIELKSNRSDWQRELKQPAKQENHFKYCDYFYLLTDRPNVAFPDEIPINWGHYHINDNGILKTIKAAPKLQSLPVDRSLLCAMLRRAASKENYVHESSIEDRITQRAESIKQQKDYSTIEKLKRYDELKKEIDEFAEATGVKDILELKKSWQNKGGKDIGKAVKYILDHGIDHYKRQMENMEAQFGRMHTNISEALKQLNGHEGK